MRPISILTLVAVLSGVSCSRTTPSEVPRAVVVPEVVDLGRIEIGQQEKKSGEFLLRNRGTGPLTIFERAVSCGCTVPDWPPSIIPAGGEALVRLTVSAKREAGAHGSVISFATNDPHNPILRIPIRWLERSAVAFDPKSLDFGRVENGKAVESTINVALSPVMAEKVLTLKSTEASLSWEWVGDGPSSLDPGAGRNRLLKVRLGSNRLAGDGSAELQLSHGSDGIPFSLPITWRTGPALEVQPKAFFHSGVLAGTSAQNRLVIRHEGRSKVLVRSLEVDGNPTDFHLESDGSGSTTPVLVVAFGVKAGTTAGIETHSVRLTIDGVGTPVVVTVTLFVK